MGVRKAFYIAAFFVQVYFILTYLYASTTSSSVGDHLLRFEKFWPMFRTAYTVHLVMFCLTIVLIGFTVLFLSKTESRRMKALLIIEFLFALFLFPGLL